MPIVDNAVYVDGRRTANPASLDDTYEALRDRNGMAWIGLYRPEESEVLSVAAEFGLHRLAVEDALHGHQRAKLERYAENLFVVLRPARYVDETESVEFGELHVFLGESFVVTIRRAEVPDLAAVRHRLEATPELLAHGPSAVLYAILDRVVDDYAPVIAGLENDIDEIEDQLFGGDPEVSKRIYNLIREVIAFQRATHPLTEILETLLGDVDTHADDIELKRGLRDVLDHAIKISERTDAFRDILQNALTLHSTLVGQAQNDEMKRLSEASLAQNEASQRVSETSLAQTEQTKKISSWAAILFAPTLIGTVYGMNFDNMPELHWTYGYPLAVAGMVVMGFVLYRLFRKRHWL